MMETKNYYNELLAKKLIEEFEKRNMDGYYCETKESAVKKVIELIPKGSLVSCGGSATLRDIGMRDVLKSGDYHFLDPDDGQGAASKDQIAHKALTADYFLMSANAIAQTGELVNADGYGNRISALIFGPKKVIVIAGLNKVERTVDAAVQRAKSYAAQNTVLLFKQDFQSFDELSETAESACSQLLITSKSVVKGRIKVILVGESLGF